MQLLRVMFENKIPSYCKLDDKLLIFADEDFVWGIYKVVQLFA